MPTVNFYLKKPEGKPPKSLIYLQMRYRGEKFIYSIGENIIPDDWDKDKQQVKSRSRTTKDGKVNLNSLLNNLKNICITTYNNEIKNGIPVKDVFKNALNEYMQRNQKSKIEIGKVSFFELIENFISGEVGDKKTDGTIKTYITAKKHLKEFEKTTKYPVDFETINLDFKYKYVNYLQKKLSHNSIAKEVKNVKTFMNMGVELGYTSNLKYKNKKFGVKEVDTDSVYLTDIELRDLFNYDLSNNKRLEPVRDLFVFSSFVGLRYGDASTIKPGNITKQDGEYIIKMITKKTKELVIIPCNDIVLSIFDKYKENSNRLPPSITVQKYNEYIKEVCMLAGMEETGRKYTEPDKPLYACISSRTARRSFATNLYLEGFPTIDLMKITGHKAEKSFMKYIKVSKLDAAKRLIEHQKTTRSKRLLKAI